MTNWTTEDQRMKKKDIEILTSKTSTHQQTLAKEAAETSEMQAAITSLSAQRDAHNATKESLKEQIIDIQRQIDIRLAAQRNHAQHIDSQSRFNGPELDFWRTYLCCEIDGAGLTDRIKFTFTHIDDRDWTREAWFELDTGTREYELFYCKPKLEKEQTERVLERFNESRDLTVLLKGMRELFVEAFKNS
jgi:kinetochore protein Spc25